MKILTPVSIFLIQFSLVLIKRLKWVKNGLHHQNKCRLMHYTLGHARLVSIKKQNEIALRRARACGKFAIIVVRFIIREDAGNLEAMTRRYSQPRRVNNCCITPCSRYIDVRSDSISIVSDYLYE